MRMKIQWRTVLMLGGALAGALGLAAAQGAVAGGDPWWYGNVFWPNLLVFLIPMIAAVGLIEVCNRLFLPGEGGAFARKCGWWALGLRTGFLIIAPILMLLWGYPSDRNRHGLLETDSINATDTAWRSSQAGEPLFATWHRSSGDNTGGITVVGVAVFRLFSPDSERTLLLGLVAAALTSLTVIAVFRLAAGLFSSGAAKVAAVIAAAYPEAVLLGSAHQQLGYLAMLLGFGLLAIAGVILNRPWNAGEPALPARRNAAILLIAVGLLGIFTSYQFMILGVIVGAVFGVWLSDPKRRIGRIVWIAAGVVAAALAAASLLAALDVIPGDYDYLFSQYRYLYGMAYEEYTKMTVGGGGDLFQNVLATVNMGAAFLLAALYGLAQPVLPAAIGHRNLSAQGGFFWQLLGIYRGLGWYLVLPLLIYATFKSLRGFLSRKAESILMVIFWFGAVIGSYRAFGDQWDNPRYRLFVFAPMAVLAAWGWVTWREQHDPWFLRIVIPFATATAGLTVWYFLRDYAMLPLPVIPSIAGLAVLTAAAFVLAFFLVRPGPRPAG
jgi:hypothetical protein